MSEDNDARLGLEIELLEAIYPMQISYEPKGREFRFTEAGTAQLHLRLPDSYPASDFPEVIVATDAAKIDVRDATKSALETGGLISSGGETLDGIITCFKDLIVKRAENHDESDIPTAQPETQSSKTTIIFLHHLLALSKRKLAVSPASTEVSGLTKPGYPGIMAFSGPAAAVAEHVDTLRRERWQAFQVRYEADEMWRFEHGKGIKECETMAEVVNKIEGEQRREIFMGVVGVK